MLSIAQSESQQRAVLLQQQDALLRALVDGSQIPRGFDAAQVEIAATSLARKRRREAAKAWPTVVRWLGRDFELRFAAYAHNFPLPTHGGPLADGLAFLSSLARETPLPDDVRLARFAVGLRYRWRSRGLHLRVGPAIKVLLLRRPIRWVIGVRLAFCRTDANIKIKIVTAPWSKC